MPDPRPITHPPAPPPAAPPRVAANMPIDVRDAPLTRPESFQFSMRGLLGLVTAVAILAAIAASAGLELAELVIAVLVSFATVAAAPICLGTLAVYCRGYRQTFFLGAFVGSLAPLLLLVAGGWRYSVWQSLFTFLVVTVFSAPCCGWLALATRRLAERRGWHVPPQPPKSDSSA